MSTFVIYGKAVQQARNALRTSQISTMFDIMQAELFKQGTSKNSAFASLFAGWVNGLPKTGPKSALDKLEAAKVSLKNFVEPDGTVLNVFAIGDVLRQLGEYIEEGGGPDNQLLNGFRDGLRNKDAFNKKTNRVRKPLLDYKYEEHPDVGIYKFHLADASVVKYMERFYGPYIGADISGTTTDALAVLALFVENGLYNKKDITNQDLQSGAQSAIGLGEELVPIATMVLQYHHSLMECGLALSLTSRSMQGADPSNSALTSYNYYDFHTLSNASTAKPIDGVLTIGNQTLQQNLAGRGLVVIRDWIDIENTDYETEIGLLIDAPANNPLFNMNSSYYSFADARNKGGMTQNYQYSKGDPTLAFYGSGVFGNIKFAGKDFGELVSFNNQQLENLKKTNKGTVYDDLDAVVGAKAPPNKSVNQALPSGSQQNMNQADLAAAPMRSSGSSVQQASGNLAKQIGNLDPQKIAALEVLLGHK